jgi:hypothetical protein
LPATGVADALPVVLVAPAIGRPFETDDAGQPAETA